MTTIDDFSGFFRSRFETLGYALGQSNGVAVSSIDTAERRLGIKTPQALNDYYAVAGREKRFNHALNRLLAPKEWSLDRGRLVFMEENQCVTVWGVSPKESSPDPSVSQWTGDEDARWYKESSSFTEFISCMLVWQAVSGGYRHCLWSPLAVKRRPRMLPDWECWGEIGHQRAYARSGCAVFLFRSMGTWMAHIGAKTKSILNSATAELRIDDHPDPKASDVFAFLRELAE